VALNNKDETVLQEIVTLEGNCLKQERCHICPFRSMCLPEFLFPKPPTQEQRKMMALKVLAHDAILNDDVETNITEEYEWPTRER